MDKDGELEAVVELGGGDDWVAATAPGTEF